MFTGTLFDIQKPAAEKLVNRRQMLLAWEQGTGKTVITAACAEKLFELKKLSTALIVAPTGLTWQWKDRLDEFTTSSSLLVEAKRKKTRTYDTDYDYLVVPYSLILRDFDVISRRKFELIALDEIQAISNNVTKTAQHLKKLNTKVKPTYRWGLTGTAISNKLEELYSILYWVDPKFLPPWPDFEEMHILRNELGAIQSYKNLKSLNTYIQARVDRKTHKDFGGQLPKILKKVHTVPQTKEYKNAQDKLLKLLDDMVENISFDGDGNPQLPQSSPVRKAFAKAKGLLYSEARLEYCERLAQRILVQSPDNRLVIFCERKEPLYDLSRKWSNSALFTGDQDVGQKRDAVHRFERGEVRVLLCSSAGEAGLDLPFARYLINLDVPVAHGRRDQRNKRITRASSKFDSVVVHDIIMEDSIEEFYLVVVENKKRLADATLEGTEDTVIIRPSSLREFLKDDNST